MTSTLTGGPIRARTADDRNSPDVSYEVELEERLRAGQSAAVLGRELLAEHDRLAEVVADLDLDDAPAWAAVRPTLARLSTLGRRTAHQLAVVRSRGRPLAHPEPALTETDAVPPVVWAREIGAVQRLVRQALRSVENDADATGHLAAVLARSLNETRAAFGELTGVIAQRPGCSH